MEYSKVKRAGQSKPLCGRWASGWPYGLSGITQRIAQLFHSLNGSIALIASTLLIEFLYKGAGLAQSRLSKSWRRSFDAIMATLLSGRSQNVLWSDAAVMISSVRFEHYINSSEIKSPSGAILSTSSECRTQEESYKAELATVMISRFCFALFLALSVIELGLVYAVISRATFPMSLLSVLVLVVGSHLILRRKITERGSEHTRGTTATSLSLESEN